MFESIDRPLQILNALIITIIFIIFGRDNMGFKQKFGCNNLNQATLKQIIGIVHFLRH